MAFDLNEVNKKLAAIEVELVKLKAQRDWLSHRKVRLRRRRTQLEARAGIAADGRSATPSPILETRTEAEAASILEPRSRDLYAVSTVTLAKYIRERKEVVSALAEKAKVSERTIQRILSGETKYATESTADNILTALGLPHILGNELKLVPNPDYRKPGIEDLDC